MHVNDQHELHAKTCKCDQSIFPVHFLPSIDEIGNGGWWDWHIQEDYEYMSPQFWTLLGYDPEVMINKPSTWMEKIYPSDLEMAKENFKLHCETHGNHPFYQEVRYFHNDGYPIYVICQGKVVEWDNDIAIRCIGTHTDITAIKKKEQEYQYLIDKVEKQNTMFRSAFAHSPSATFLCNDQGYIIDINQKTETLLERPKSEILGRQCLEFTVAEDIDITINASKMAKESGIPQRLQKRYFTSQGSIVLCDTTVVFIDTYLEKYFVLQSVDITRKQAVKKSIYQTLNSLRDIVYK